MENTINGRYEIICKLGAGGTSIVYKARDLSTGKLAAVKVLLMWARCRTGGII